MYIFYYFSGTSPAWPARLQIHCSRILWQD